MWIVLNNAFLSIVEPSIDEAEPGQLLVRSRVKGDIQRVFPEAEVVQTLNRDYRFRALVDREDVANAMHAQVMGISYDNFKNSVAEDSRHSAYAEIWGVMFRLQGRLGGKTIAEHEKAISNGGARPLPMSFER
jgi:hypothetical protein